VHSRSNAPNLYIKKFAMGERCIAAKRVNRIFAQEAGAANAPYLWNAPVEEIRQVAETFVLANCLNPEIARLQFEPP
jgi:hypothetical protein